MARKSSNRLRLRALAGLAAVLCLPGMAWTQARRLVRRGPEEVVTVAPVPSDPHELVKGVVSVASTPEERNELIGMLRDAVAKGLSHKAGMEPFHLDASFTAAGKLTYTGPGRIKEIWLSGKNWQVTESIGDYTLTRTSYGGDVVDDQPVSLIPMRAQMLRNEILWAASADAGVASIRKAPAMWNGRPVTCVLLSNADESLAKLQTRLWEENEYCVANDTHALVMHSIVPGTYAVFSYTRNLRFHRKSIPDRITIFVDGEQAVDANLHISDPSGADEELFAAPAEAFMHSVAAIALSDARITAVDVPNGASGGVVEPAMIHLQLNGEGAVLDAEPAAAANPSLTDRAIEVAKGLNLGGGLSHAYVEVRFLPASR